MAVRRRNPYVPLIELLTGKVCARYQRLDYEAWGADCGMTESTLRRRLATPEKFQLGELGKISRSLGISTEEIMRAAMRV